VIVTNDQDGDSSLQALRTKDGSIAWRVARHTREKQNASYAAPCIYHPAKGADELILNSWAYGISGIDPLSGKTLWELPVFPKRPVGSPALADGLILGTCGEGAGNNTLVALRPPASPSASPGSASASPGSAPASPEVVYQLDKTTAPYVPSVLVVGDMAVLWADKGFASCIDTATGNFHWKVKRIGGNFSGSPIRVGEASRATPAVVGNRMYLRTASHLTCLESDEKPAR
jgi:outer membrane protein assembly factor BamB